MKYVICKGGVTAGLGDLILALITATAYAKLTDRHLCVDWRNGIYGMPSDENLFDKIFKLRDVKYEPGIPTSGSVNPSLWEGNLEKSFEELRKENDFPEFDRELAIRQYSIDYYNTLDHEEDIVVMWDFDYFEELIGPLTEKGIIDKPASVYHAMGQIFNKYIEFQPEPGKFIDDRLKRVFGQVNSSKLLGVHIRETKESFDLYRPTKRRRYYREIKSILNRDKSVEYLFLATDNIKVQNRLVSKYGGKVLINEKWFDDPGDALHLSLEKCPDKWENILNALFDIYALSRCDYLIRRRATSFSNLSQCIGLIKEENVRIIDKERTMRQKASTWKHNTLGYLNQAKKKLVHFVAPG